MATNTATTHQYVQFSPKQKQVLTWWIPNISPYANHNAIICDGSVRSGKTLVTSLSYIIWLMETFNGQKFGMSGKTIDSFKRNVWLTLVQLIKLRGYEVFKVPAIENAYTISKNGIRNDIYIFGGKDEGSRELVQGFTAAGFFFDEVALMPKSFVNQAVVRCSVPGSKLWFNCNPEKPKHWFNVEWIQDKENKKALHLHFTLDDNPSLTDERKQFYKNTFKGVFYDRFILGLWKVAEGLIYTNWKVQEFDIQTIKQMYPLGNGLDYGYSKGKTALSQFAIDVVNKRIWIYGEHYEKEMLTQDIVKMLKQKKLANSSIIADSQEKRLTKEIRNSGINNIQLSVKGPDSIRQGIMFLQQFEILVHPSCINHIFEFENYVWHTETGRVRKEVIDDEQGMDKPREENDHLMDALRYGVQKWHFEQKQVTKKQEEAINKVAMLRKLGL